MARPASLHPARWTRWQRHLAALVALAGAILLMFHRDAGDMLVIWWHSSTFTHCLLMIPMIGWLVSQRWGQLRGLSPIWWWPAIGWLAAGGLGWLAGEAAGVAVLRHLGLVLMLQGAVAATLGDKLVRALLFPLAYALLLIPFGEQLVPLLQAVTARLSVALLHLAGVGAAMEGIFITTAAGYFEVAEECSGVNFLIAMFAYSVFAAHLCFHSWYRRILFVSLALATTIIANAVRAAATMAAAEIWGIEAAGGFDHIVYGWIFFGSVILLVMLVARRWFDRPADDVAVDVTGLETASRLAGPAHFVLLAALGVPLLFAAWGQLAGSRSAPLPATLVIAVPSGWTPAAHQGGDWWPRFDGADQLVMRDFAGPRGRRITVALAGYERQAEGREVVGFGQGAVDPDSKWVRSATLPAIEDARGERLFHPGKAPREAARWFVVGGRATGDPYAAKLEGLKVRLLGGDPRALSLIVSSNEGEGGHDAIRNFVAASGGAQAMADRALETR